MYVRNYVFTEVASLVPSETLIAFAVCDLSLPHAKRLLSPLAARRPELDSPFPFAGPFTYVYGSGTFGAFCGDHTNHPHPHTENRLRLIKHANVFICWIISRFKV